MDALEAILTRRSTRKYTEEIPDKELIKKVIEAGRGREEEQQIHNL